MEIAHQLPLFDVAEKEEDIQVQSIYTLKELGTFKESMQAPIHGWFRYPAGYSYRFVDITFDHFKIKPGQWVYDPFSGTGTTLICAKQRGINAYGVEAHSFVHWVADVKLFWEYDFKVLGGEIEKLLTAARTFVGNCLEEVNVNGIFPELVYKCYHPQDLKVLYLLREFIIHQVMDYHIQNLLRLALTDTLRGAAAAGTGWPYISPRKNTGEKPPKNALIVFQATVRQMYADLRQVAKKQSSSEVNNVLGDSRTEQSLSNNQVQLALTSPPYLNNYDYADRTRLETYFWGITQTWGDITREFRDKLMVAATTQVVRSHYNVATALSTEIEQIARPTYQQIQSIVMQLASLRKQKGGKKDYDLMVALYFNDILKVIQETYRVLDANGHLCIVLGDSAPYGVHISTDQIVGELGLAIGFKGFEYHELRGRGDKWKANPQRHHVKLREGVVILTK